MSDSNWWKAGHDAGEREAATLTRCPCGTAVSVPFNTGVGGGQFAIWDVECWNCGRRAASGNTRTGVVSEWISEDEIDAANAIFNQQWEL